MLVPTEESKIERFVAGLNWDTRMALVVCKFRTLSEAYSSAADHYRVLSMRRGVQDRAKRHGEGGASDPKKPKVGDSSLGGFQKGYTSGGGVARPGVGQGPKPGGGKERHFYCKRCGRDHPGRDCDGHLVECFSCGLRGHRAFECISKKGGSFYATSGVAPEAQAVTRPSKEAEGHDGGRTSGSRGYPAGMQQKKIFVMSRTQAEASGLQEGNH